MNVAVGLFVNLVFMTTSDGTSYPLDYLITKSSQRECHLFFYNTRPVYLSFVLVLYFFCPFALGAQTTQKVLKREN